MHTTPEFTLTPQDFTRLQRALQRRLAQRLERRWIVLVAKFVVWMLISSTLFMFLKLHERVPEEAAAFAATGALVALLLLAALALPYVRQGLYRKRLISPRGSFLATQRVAFSDEGVVVSAAGSRSERAWTCFLGNDADDANHYLYVDACSAIVVPRSAVAGFQADFDRYIAKIGAD